MAKTSPPICPKKIFVEGNIIEGMGLARMFDYATINIQFDSLRTILPGVYICDSEDFGKGSLFVDFACVGEFHVIGKKIDSVTTGKKIKLEVLQELNHHPQILEKKGIFGMYKYACNQGLKEINPEFFNDIFFTPLNNFPFLSVLEEKAFLIEKEIPPFEPEKVRVTRKREDWINEKMDQLFDDLSQNVDWIKTSDVWFNFPLIYNGKPVGLAKEICPNTIRILLEEQPYRIQVCGFSLLKPGGKIDVHNDDTGPSFGSLALNLHLKGSCSSLFVGVEEGDTKRFVEKKHEKHKAIIFNSERYHFAVNEHLSEDRIILYIDFLTDCVKGRQNEKI